MAEEPKKKRPIRLGSSKSKSGKKPTPSLMRGTKTKPGAKAKLGAKAKPPTPKLTEPIDTAGEPPPVESQAPPPPPQKKSLRMRKAPPGKTAPAPPKPPVLPRQSAPTLQPADHTTKAVAPSPRTPSSTPVVTKPKIRTGPRTTGEEPENKKVLPNSPGLPYALVQGELVDAPGSQSAVSPKQRSSLERPTDTGSLTMRIPTLRNKAPAQAQAVAPTGAMAMAAGASPQPPRDLADSLRAHPLPDALQPGQRPVDSREVEKLAAGERSLLDAQRQIATLQSGRDAMKEQNERLQREVLDAQRQIATLQSGRDAMKEQNERLQREVLDAQRQIATLQSGRDAMKEQDERLQREVLALTKENAEMQTAQTEAQTHGAAGIRSLQLDLDKAASRNGVLQGKLQELIVEKVKLTKGSEALKGKLAEAEQRAEALKETSAQAKQIPAMRKELATANGKLKAVVDQYRTLSVKAKGHEAAAKEYLDQKMALEAKLASAQKVPPAAFLAARKEAAEFKARAGILTKKLQGLAGLDQKTFADLKEKNTELEKAVEAKKSDAARLTRLEIENRILKDKVTELMR
ncbi:MAG TPA: hypothetical protein DCR55_04015 [Lentisphaeria bacterium]|nr:hypothetical protein [Lentisphaeria bacterium]